MNRDLSAALLTAIALFMAIVGLTVLFAPKQFESDDWTSKVFPPPSVVSGDLLTPYEHYSTRNDGFNALPDPTKTPGAIFQEADLEKIRKPNYSKSVRDVTESMHKQVFAAYGIPWSEHDKYEDDHLIPLSLGGSNDNHNRWPQKRTGEWNSLMKDNLEKRALKLVRDGEWELRATQKQFADDWRVLYRKAFPGEEPKEAHIEASEQ